MTATSVVCPECGSPVAPGRLSCQSCGTLLASVVGSSRRYANAPVVDPMLPEVDEDRPIASARRAEPEMASVPTPTPIVVDPGPPVAATPPAQPAKRAPRRLPRPRPAATAETSTVAAAAEDAQTSIFGPVPNVAPPILHGWSDPAAGSAADTAVASAPETATVPAATTARPPKPPRQQRPPDAPRNGSAPVEPPPVASTNGTVPSGGSVAGAYLAPSATYASPVATRPGSAVGTGRAASAAPAPAPAWPDPFRATVPGTAYAGYPANGHPANGASAVAGASVADQSGATARRMSDWLVIGGSTLAIVSFVLPWATDGVLGSRGVGYTAEWGLANLGHLLLIAAAAGILILHLVETPVPGWIRSGVLPIAVGGLLAGLAFAYYAGPFGGGTGVAVLLAGAVLLLVGGIAASRPERHEVAPPTV